ncbi:MAG: hypothetical protein ACYDEY_07140 [Acidimicrobiales bacterium]
MDLFVYLVATVETLIVAALILGFAREITYISAAGFSFLIWSTAEGFGGLYRAGSTDVGACIIDVVVFLGSLALNLYAAPARYSLDYHLEKRISWWSRLAEARYQEPVESDSGPAGAQPTPVPGV